MHACTINGVIVGLIFFSIILARQMPGLPDLFRRPWFSYLAIYFLSFKGLGGQQGTSFFYSKGQKVFQDFQGNLVLKVIKVIEDKLEVLEQKVHMYIAT